MQELRIKIIENLRNLKHSIDELYDNLYGFLDNYLDPGDIFIMRK